LSVVICGMDLWDNDEISCIYVHPEFIFNVAWNMEPPPENDAYRDIDLDQIQEIIVNNIKYTFVPLVF
jgi:hypothetical protein